MCMSASSKAAKNSKLETSETRYSVYHPVTTRLAAVGEGFHRFYGRANEEVLVVCLLVSQ